MNTETKIKIEVPFEFKGIYSKDVSAEFEELLEKFKVKFSVSEHGYLRIFTLDQLEFDRLVDDCYRYDKNCYFVRKAEKNIYNLLFNGYTFF